MKKNYIKPNTEEIKVKLEQMIAGSLDLNNADASVTGGYYNDSPEFVFDDLDF